MLSLAREAILSALQGKPLHHTAWESSCLSERQGVFVTLEVQGKLRGCIGVIEAHNPLRESIVHCAQSAALRDSRFPPLSADELDALQIEISVLSVLSKMDPREIEIGTHGLVIAAGEKRGLLLPQVATEQHLSREQFLQETCRKAGLSRHAWQESATSVYGFTCEIFREDSRSANA
jgi:AmmeMemoRadiSam system protein A